MNTNNCCCYIKERICGYAEQDESIKAVIVIGSLTRSDVPADEYSDLDITKTDRR